MIVGKIFKKRVLSKKIKTALIILLVGSWTFASWPAIPFINFPPKIQEAQAAFPSVVTTATSLEDAANVTSHTVTLPSGIVSGDLLIVVFSTDGNPGVTWGGTGFTEFFEVAESTGRNALALAYKQAVGGETSIVVTTGAGERSAHISYRITGHEDPATQAPEASPGAQGITANPDPDLLTPTGGAKDYLWLAVHARDRNRTTTGFPNATYGNDLSTQGGGANSAGVGSTEKQENLASEDPGTFTISTSDEWVAATIAVHPAAPATLILTQNDFELFVDNDALTPTDEWPAGSLALGENVALTAVPPAFDPMDLTDEIRIRMNISVTGLQLDAATEGFILQYKETNDCTDATTWTDVDVAGGGGTWRFAASSVANDTALDGADLKISTSEEEGRYNKVDPTGTNPVAVPVGQELEWDWHIEYNGNAEAHTYCFRMIKDDPADLDAYNADSYPKVDTRPTTADQMRHGNFFSTGEERGFFWAD